jgi:hypothetical protein
MRTILMIAMVAACTPATAGAKTRTLKPVAHLATPRASHSATVLSDGTLLIAGGFRKGPDGRSQVYTATTEIFDPKSGELRAGPEMGEARSGHIAAQLPDGGVLLAGGWNERGLLRSAEIYEPSQHEFVAVGDLTEARGGATATVLTDGRVLITGGGDDGRASATAEVYDPATATFAATGAMAMARVGHTATRLADGRVLIVGGADAGDDVLASAELYDPETGTFAATGSLEIARYKHGAVLRDDGTVLIAGGSSAEDWRGKHATTEIYSPARGTFATGPRLANARFKLPGAIVIDASSAIVIAGGARTVERIGRDGKRRTVAHLGRAAYYATAVAIAGGVVLVGGYGDDVQAGDEVWTIR